MLRRRKDRDAVKEFCETVRKDLGTTVQMIILFGSKATDKDVPGSDIDLFVAVSERTPEIESAILDIAFELDLKYDVYISPRILPQSVLKDPLWKVTPFLKNIRREGVKV